MAQPFDVVVDRAVLLDVGVGLRDVRLGLVVVVITDEVLDGVVRQHLSKLVGQLGGQRLVGRHHQGGALQPLDEPGRRRRLAGAGGAEQHDVALPRLDAAFEFVDRGGLVAGGLVRTDHLEPGARTHHVLDRAVFRVRNHRVFGSECHDHRLSAVADTFIPRPFPARPRGTRLTRVPEPARLAVRLLGLSRPKGTGPITIDLRRLRRP